MTTLLGKTMARFGSTWLSVGAAVVLVWLLQLVVGRVAAHGLAQVVPSQFTDQELWRKGGLLLVETLRLRGEQIAEAFAGSLVVALAGSLAVLAGRYWLYGRAGRWFLDAAARNALTQAEKGSLPNERSRESNAHSTDNEDDASRGRAFEGFSRPHSTGAQKTFRTIVLAHSGASARFLASWLAQLLLLTLLAMGAWFARRLTLNAGWQGLAPTVVIVLLGAGLGWCLLTWLEVGRLFISVQRAPLKRALPAAVRSIASAPRLLWLRACKGLMAFALSAMVVLLGPEHALVGPAQLAVAQLVGVALVWLDAVWLGYAGRVLFRQPSINQPRPPGDKSARSGAPAHPKPDLVA